MNDANRLRIAFLLLTVFVCSTQLVSAQKQKPAKSGDKKSSGEIVDGEIGKALDAVLLETDTSDGGFCGVAMVGSRGKVLLEKGYGIFDAEAKKPMPADALFDQASVTKQFTAAAMLRLIEFSRLTDDAQKKLGQKRLVDGLKKFKKLSLDDPLSRFFPKAPKDKANVNLRQLLNHTSGIEAGFKSEWSFDSSSRDSFVECKLSRPMTSKPGEKHDYSNSGYALLAAIIEIVSGMTFEEFTAEFVFKPAGMKSATMIGCPDLDLSRVPKIDRGKGFTDRPKDFSFAYGNKLNWGYRGCGGVVASTHDMFLWDRALRDPKFLTKAMLDELYRPALENYALGWEVRKAPGGIRVEHSGGVLGVVTYYMRHLEEDYVIALACSYRPPTHPAQTCERLAQIVMSKR